MNFLATAGDTVLRSEKAFTSLVNQYLDEIYNYARYMLADSTEAEDITQKTFLSLYQNIQKLDLTTSIRPWLFKVARNHCLSYLKKMKPETFTGNEDAVSDIPDNYPSIESKLDDQITMDRFRMNLETLPTAEKEVLLLKYFEDLTFEQISEIQGVSENTIKSHFYRGKNKLFNLIKD